MNRVRFVLIFVAALVLSTNAAPLLLVNESELREAEAALFNSQMSTSGWVLLNYVGTNTVSFAAGGEGGADEFRELLKDDQVQYIKLRLGGITEPGTTKTTTRDVFITWIGPSVGPITKGQRLGQMNDAIMMMQPYHAAVVALRKTNFNDETILDRSHPLSGSHTID